MMMIEIRKFLNGIIIKCVLIELAYTYKTVLEDALKQPKLLLFVCLYYLIICMECVLFEYFYSFVCLYRVQLLYCLLDCDMFSTGIYT